MSADETSPLLSKKPKERNSPRTSTGPSNENDRVDESRRAEEDLQELEAKPAVKMAAIVSSDRILDFLLQIMRGFGNHIARRGLVLCSEICLGYSHGNRYISCRYGWNNRRLVLCRYWKRAQTTPKHQLDRHRISFNFDKFPVRMHPQ